MLVKRGEAVTEYDRIFLRTARMFEDLCCLAGYDGLADRVRPSTRSPGRTEQKADIADEVVTDALGSDAERQDEIGATVAIQDVAIQDVAGQNVVPRSLSRAMLASPPAGPRRRHRSPPEVPTESQALCFQRLSC